MVMDIIYLPLLISQEDIRHINNNENMDSWPQYVRH